MVSYLILECPTCETWIKLPLHQFKDGGIGIDKLKCIFCNEILKPTDIHFENFKWSVAKKAKPGGA